MQHVHRGASQKSMLHLIEQRCDCPHNAGVHFPIQHKWAGPLPLAVYLYYWPIQIECLAMQCCNSVLLVPPTLAQKSLVPNYEKREIPGSRIS